MVLGLLYVISLQSHRISKRPGRENDAMVAECEGKMLNQRMKMTIAKNNCKHPSSKSIQATRQLL